MSQLNICSNEEHDEAETEEYGACMAENDAKTKELLKEVVIELIEGKRDLFYEIIMEALEEIALANAIKEGRQNDFVSEDKIFALLEN
ncbi:hypothetical protein QUF74_14980 [Candidatus Halobeggiatoa sp. HSG11]|nr:hypothetical protein [Candidatus Halobeggiatoa sp. HSG11]